MTVIPADERGQKGAELYNVEPVAGVKLNGIEAFKANVESGEIVVGENDGFTITGLTRVIR